MLHIYEAQEDETQLEFYHSWAHPTLANHENLDLTPLLALASVQPGYWMPGAETLPYVG